MLSADRATGRKQATACLSVAVGLAIVVGLGVVYHHHAQESRWRQSRVTLQGMAASGDRIAQAIDRYHAEHAKYPSDFRQLAKATGEVLPPKPSLASRYWEYSVDGGGSGYQVLLYLPYDVWPHGWGFWTCLCYRSDHSYPREAFGGMMVERIGQWAFYVE